MRRVVVAVLLSAAVLTVSASPASAGIWTPIASATTSDITGIAYQSDSRFWFVTGNGEIFTRQGDGTFARTYGPSAIALRDIAFQPGGNIGIAVGDDGQVLRSTDAGMTWSNVNPAGTPIPVSKKGTTFSDCSASAPLGNVNSVRFAGSGRVWLFAEGAQMAKSESGATVGATGTWVDANRAADDSCKLSSADTGYSAGIDDAFFTANPDVAYICAGYFGPVFFTSNDLATTATKKTGDCGNGSIATRRMAGDAGNPNHQWAVGPDTGGPNRSYMHYTGDAWATSSAFTLANPDAHALGNAYDVAQAGGTVVAIGDQGMILNNIDGTGNFYNNAADGALASTAWHAVGLASASQAAVGGAGGALVVTTQANTIPDIVAPAGTVTGPATAVAGRATQYTANVADNAGGSGINPASFAWSAAGLTPATGNPVSLTFPSAGYYTVHVSFRDNAGNVGEATLSVTVTAPVPVPPAVVPVKRTVVTVSGGTVTLSSPKRCVPAGTSFKVTLAFKRRTTSASGRVIKVTKVVFYIDGKKKVTDRKAPFAQRLTVKNLKAGTTHKLKARATLKVRHGKSPTRSISTTFSVCK